MLVRKIVDIDRKPAVAIVERIEHRAVDAREPPAAAPYC
jgi:hypothetical protein